MTVHTLRKSSGQNWAKCLPMNVVKEFMGHASISTTAEFYTTVSEDQADHARWAVEAMMVDGSEAESDARVTPEPPIGSKRKVG